MRDCPYRITDGAMRCQIHVDNGVIDLSISEGTCENCFFFQSHGIDIQKASLSIIKDYVEVNLKSIKLFSREAANQLFDTAFNYATKVLDKPKAIEFLTNVLVKFSENPAIKEEDIERAFNEFGRFEKST